jgi:glycosyltransferase involved in cell wall biosynthesis
MKLLLFNLKTDSEDDALGFTTDWINELAGYCEKVIVITMSAGSIVVANNVKVYSVGKELHYSEPRRAIEFYRLLIWILFTERIDACFAHMMPLFAVMGWPILRILGIPIVLWYAHSHVTWMLKLATFLVDRVVTSSRTGFQIPTSKRRIIGQGIDVDRFHPVSDSRIGSTTFVILTVGRIAPVKRLELLIQALTLLPERLPNGRPIIARFVGNPQTSRDREYLRKLHQLTIECGVATRVEFSPAYPFGQIDRAYREADLFVNSSDTDSVDKSVLEAMSSGLPVLTSNTAFADIFDSSCSALCHVEKGDKRLLADALLKLLKMKDEERRLLGVSLREIVCKHHSLTSLSNRLIRQIKKTQKQ